MNLVFLYNAYNLQRSEEWLFQNIFQVKEQLTKTREKIFHYIHDGMLVLSGETKKHLFRNQAFDRIMAQILQRAATESCNLRREAEVSICLEKLVVDTNSFNKKIIKEFFYDKYASSAPEKNSTLLNVTNDLVKYDFLREDPVEFRVSFADPASDIPRIYQVRTFRTFWHSEETIVLIFDDVTDKEAAVYLRMSDTNKDKIISTVSHEFRTPLNGILGILQIMEKNSLDPEISKYINLCKSNASLLLSISNTMLDIQQIREGKFKLHSSKTHLIHMLEEVKSLFDFQCNSKDIFLKIKMGPGVPKYINTDVNRLKQILINLTGNALKFTFEGGITILIEEDSDHEECLLFSIIDTGVGIAEEDKTKLFKRFGKLERTEEINKSGSGLGLMISDTLARLLDVSKDDKGIKVDSEVGKGSKFHFTISKDLRRIVGENASKNSYESDGQEEVSDESLRSVEEKMNSHSLSLRRSSFVPSIKLNVVNEFENNSIFDTPKKLLYGSNTYLDVEQTTFNSRGEVKSNYLSSPKPDKRSSFFRAKFELTSPRNTSPLALIVDDNPFNIMVAQNLVQAGGFKVRGAFNGKSAIEMVKDQALVGQPFKLILMDCEMPIINGFETTKALREMIESGEIPDVPIVALTAHDKTEEKKKCLESGMLEVLVKPINEKKLNKVLEKYK